MPNEAISRVPMKTVILGERPELIDVFRMDIGIPIMLPLKNHVRQFCGVIMAEPNSFGRILGDQSSAEWAGIALYPVLHVRVRGKFVATNR